MKRLLVIFLVLLIVPTASAQPAGLYAFSETWSSSPMAWGVNSYYETGVVSYVEQPKYRELNDTHRYESSGGGYLNMFTLDVLQAIDMSSERNPTSLNIKLLFMGEMFLEDVIEQGDYIEVQILRFNSVRDYKVNITADVGYFSFSLRMRWTWETWYTIEEITEDVTTEPSTTEPIEDEDSNIPLAGSIVLAAGSFVIVIVKLYLNRRKNSHCVSKEILGDETHE